jgi:hypothetical protein
VHCLCERPDPKQPEEKKSTLSGTLLDSLRNPRNKLSARQMLLIGKSFVVMSDSEISYGLSETSCARTLSSVHQVHDAIVHRPRPRWPKPGGHHGESPEALDSHSTRFDGRLFCNATQEAYRTLLALSFTMRQANILLVQNVQQSLSQVCLRTFSQWKPALLMRTGPYTLSQELIPSPCLPSEPWCRLIEGVLYGNTNDLASFHPPLDYC